MKRSRPVLFGIVLTVHLLLIALIAGRHAPRSPPPGERALVVTQLPRPVPPVPPRPPPRPRTTRPEQSLPVPPPPAPAAPPPDFSDCATLAAVQAALAADPRVQEVLATVPIEARSVSNTIMLWDGTWADAAAPGRLDPIRAVLHDALAAQPTDCLEQPLAGPRLFVVSEAGGTAVSLMIGSGRWQWRDVQETLDSKSAAPAARQASIGSHRRD